MFAKFDSRKTYFDGLGEIITNANSSEQAIKLAKLDYEVVKQPLFVQSPLRKVANQFATVRTDTKDILGVVGKNYNILQNKEAFDFLDGLVEGGATIETGGTYRGSSASFITASTEPMNILGDEFKPYLLIMNSFDGSGSVRVMFTPVRVFCSNCLALAIKQAVNKVSIKHTNNLAVRMQTAKDILLSNTKYLEELNRRAELFAKIPFSVRDFEKMGAELFPIDEGVSVVIRQRQEQKRDALKFAYNQADLQNYNNTAYKMIQAVSDFESHQPRFKNTNNPYSDMQVVVAGMPLVNEVFARLMERVPA